MCVCSCSIVSNSLPLTCIYIYMYTYIHIYVICTHCHMESVLYTCSLAPVTANSLWPHGLVAHQAPLSMIFFWQEYWSGLPCPPPRDLPNPGIKLASLASHVLQQILYCWATREAPIHTILLSIFSSRTFFTSAFPSTQNAVSLFCHCISEFSFFIVAIYII